MPANLAEPMVWVAGFRMDFGATTVIRDLSFEVRAGETFGFLGSNGSGKTTTIRALLGIYTPTGGVLHVAGRPFQPAGGVRLGYLPEERGLYKKESVLDVMGYFGTLKGMQPGAARAWSRTYLERVGIGAKERVRLDKLSGGEQQKVQLGVTIMNDPELLILDEPTKGFDPVNRRLVMDIIEAHHAAGTTVMMVTHQMEEVERLCDRVLLLKDGAARAYGTVEEVQAQFGGTVIDVEHDGRIPPSPRYSTDRDHDGGGRARLQAGDGVDPAAILAELTGAGVRVRAFTPRRPSLDDIFIQVYGEPTPAVAR